MARGTQQAALLCGCGAPELAHGDVCRRCDRRARLSREHFAGLRESVLRRDDWQCQTCGQIDRTKLLVHHRRPGFNRPAYLVTLCRACHVRVHRTARPSFGFAAPLRRLWREANRGLAEQRLLLTDGAAAVPSQTAMF